MNENNTPSEQPTPSPQPTQGAVGGAPSGHEVPASFSSESSSAAKPSDAAAQASTAAPAAAASAAPAAPASAAPAADIAPSAAAPAFPAPDSAPQSAQPQASAVQTHQPQPSGPQTYPGAPQQPGQAPAYASGAAFGLPPQGADGQTQPIPPLTAEQPPAKRSGGKIAALVVAAALVGGIAGFGGAAAWNATTGGSEGTTATGPGTITVNNPGSVNETTAIASTALPSVVTIQVAGQEGSGSGSGVILSKDGYVLTNTHVVTLGGAAADPTVRVTTSDGRIYDATIVGTDPMYDLAVIKLEDASGLTPITFADSSKLNVGDTAVAVGAPLGLANSVTTGIVSALNRSIQIASAAAPETEEQEPQDESESSESPFQFDLPGQPEQQTASESISIAVIQTDAAINPGNSGGALVDSKGELIGINVAIATAGSSNGEESGSIGVGFSIPSDIAKRIADELMENGEATHGLLGASVRDASTVEGASVAGAYVVEVTPGGAAEKAGLKEGDIVTEFNGAPITGATDLTAQVRAEAAGSEDELSYVRDGKSYQADVTLGELES